MVNETFEPPPTSYCSFPSQHLSLMEALLRLEMSGKVKMVLDIPPYSNRGLLYFSMSGRSPAFCIPSNPKLKRLRSWGVQLRSQEVPSSNWSLPIGQNSSPDKAVQEYWGLNWPSPSSLIEWEAGRGKPKGTDATSGPESGIVTQIICLGQGTIHKTKDLHKWVSIWSTVWKVQPKCTLEGNSSLPLRATG